MKKKQSHHEAAKDTKKHKAGGIPTLEEIARRGVLNLSQLQRVEKLILERGNFSRERTRREIAWFCLDLGIAGYYFQHTPLEEIARHIESFRAARIIAENSGGRTVNIQLINEQGESATYMVEENYEQIRTIEQRIENHFPHFRLQSYRSRAYPIRLYLVTRPDFRPLPPGVEPEFAAVASRQLQENSPPPTIKRYQLLWEEAQGRRIPLIRFSGLPETGETRVMVFLERETALGFFTDLTFILKKSRLHTNREYVEPFADGTVIFSFYLDQVADSEQLDALTRDIGMATLLSPSPLMELFYSGDFSAQETMYATASAGFAHQFLTTYDDHYVTLAQALAGKPELLDLLSVFRSHLAKDTYHEDRVNGVVLDHPELVRELYRSFHEKFCPAIEERRCDFYLDNACRRIGQEVTSEIARHVLEAMVVFNRSILKTNFFKTEKSCVSFRLDPAFLNRVDYPHRPHGIFYLLGKGFRGFHIRFQEIARGGVRLVKSPTQIDYDLNSDFIFDENYNLALTQERKNKDIPEGGAKGAILPARNFQNQGEAVFKQYIDGLLDLLLLPHPQVIDYHGREEMLFLGPDEGTAEMMDWAAEQARRRGYRYWKAFTTGKSPRLGGVPHDVHGMTTHGVRQYVLEAFKVLGWKEEEVTKFQTGGPDGDLGSNEIRLSRARTLAVVDAAGVLFDPDGLNRDELLRLAEKRLTVSYFDRNKLSPQGFFVGVENRQIKLPGGELVANGLDFRNRFHFHPGLKADLFVPCGGRPRAINMSNWKEFFDSEGSPRARLIVEGANLFITQEARLRLEEKGVILFKDASANKGGVTSSSLEVLAALALADEEFSRLMVIPPAGKEPNFRSHYVERIIETIRRNATREFHLLWSEHQRSRRHLSVLSDILSNKINAVTAAIFNSGLFENAALCRAVIERYCPAELKEAIGIEKLMERVPRAYLRAIFASELASSYVYEKGLEAGELDFFDFVNTRFALAPRPDTVKTTARRGKRRRD